MGSSPKAVEVMAMLDMLTCMQNHESLSAEGETMFINDNELWNKEANENWSKAGNRANDAGRIVTKVKEATCSLNCEIIFELIIRYKSKMVDFKIDRLKSLMKSCDKEARRVLSEIKTKAEHSNSTTLQKLWN